MYPYIAGSHHPLAEYSTNEDGLIDENFHSGESASQEPQTDRAAAIERAWYETTGEDTWYTQDDSD